VTGTVHVIGTGLSGLACSLSLVKAGRTVVVHDAAAHAGGRARSFHDPALDRLIDNGNHLMLGANPALFAYLDDIGAHDVLDGQARAVFPFVDLASGERWVIRPNAGRLPWWIAAPSRRVPGSRWYNYLAALRLHDCPPEATVAEVLGSAGPINDRLWKPFCDAVLNAAPTDAAAALLWPVLRETFLRGEVAMRAYIARDGLSPALIDPALAWLKSNGASFRFNNRLRTVHRSDTYVDTLEFTSGSETLGEHDAAVLAVPPTVAAGLLHGLPSPEDSRAIVNGHFLLDRPAALPGGERLLGLVGGTAHWLFARGDVVSVTVSAAQELVDEPADAIAARLWSDIVAALGLAGTALPTHRIVKEKRATFAQTPASLSRRPGPRIGFANFFLAGDWTDTHLPATIEGAIRSGRLAAKFILGKA
jgi:squalene-associated FAD-dependent desaturase